MTTNNKVAASASLAVALLSAAALATGIGLMVSLGGSSGRDLGSGASSAAFASAVPLLLAAEILKLLTGLAQFLVARNLPDCRGGSLMRVVGYAGALLIASSGVVGLYAIAVRTAELGQLISGIGFAGVACTGVWILLTLWHRPLLLPRWLVIAGALSGSLAIGALALPPLAMLSAITGWFWWGGLWSRLRR